MKPIIALLLIAISLGGCALVAAGIGGVVIERHHQHWCYWHPYAFGCGHSWR